MYNYLKGLIDILSRVTPHSAVSTGVTPGPGSLDSSATSRFHPYRPSAGGGGGGGAVGGPLGLGHSVASMANSQYAAFDSLYKAYQSGYNPAAAAVASMYGGGQAGPYGFVMNDYLLLHLFQHKIPC